MWYANGTDRRTKGLTVDFLYPGDEQIVVRDAEILGFGSSRGEANSKGEASNKDRWSELTIVGTDKGYFVAGVGKSILPGETDRHWCAAHPDAWTLVKGLMRPDGRGGKFLPVYAREALNSAAEVDYDVRDTVREFARAFSWES